MCTYSPLWLGWWALPHGTPYTCRLRWMLPQSILTTSCCQLVYKRVGLLVFFYTRRQPFTCCAWFCYDGQVQKPLPCWVKLLNSRSKEYTCIWGFLELRVVTKRGTLRERACKIVPENCLFCCVPFITLDIIRRGFVKTCHKRVKIYLWLYLVNTPWGRSLSLTIWSSSRRRPFCRGDSSATTQTEQKTRSTSESTGPEKSSRDARLNCRNCV